MAKIARNGKKLKEMGILGVKHRCFWLGWSLAVRRMGGLRLGLIGVNGQYGQDERREKLGLIGFELGLFFF